MKWIPYFRRADRLYNSYNKKKEKKEKVSKLINSISTLLKDTTLPCLSPMQTQEIFLRWDEVKITSNCIIFVTDVFLGGLGGIKSFGSMKVNIFYRVGPVTLRNRSSLPILRVATLAGKAGKAGKWAV